MVSYASKCQLRFHSFIDGLHVGVYFNIFNESFGKYVEMEVFVEKTRRMCNIKWKQCKPAMPLNDLSLNELTFVLDSYRNAWDIEFKSPKYFMQSLLYADIVSAIVKNKCAIGSVFKNRFDIFVWSLFHQWGGVKPNIPSVNWVTIDSLTQPDRIKDSYYAGMYDNYTKKVYVALDRPDVDEIISTLVHELRHHWQLLNGFRFDFTIPYEQRPEEIDARWAQEQPLPTLVDIKHLLLTSGITSLDLK